MNRLPVLLLIFAIIGPPLPGQEMKTAKDFDPPPPDEKPIFGDLVQTENPAVGFWIGTGTTAAGAILSGVALGYTLQSALDRDVPSINQGALLTGTGIVLTAVSAVITDFFLREWTKNQKDKKESISVE